MPIAVVVTGVLLVGGACSSSERPLLGDEAGTASETERGATSGADEATASADGQGADEDRFEPDPEPVSAADLADLPEPDQVIPEVVTAIGDAPPEGHVLDTIEPLDRTVEVSTDRDGRTRNAAGELVGLDDLASLACASVEIALTAIDEGDEAGAAAGVAAAADRAGRSEMTSVQVWQEPLASAVTGGAVSDVAPLIGFIAICAEGGYEL